MNLHPVSVDNSYRPAPFWSWNDNLDPEELRRQIRMMHEAGLGGFFMHARGGLQTEYLSPKWMDCVSVCLEEAGKLGMQAWLYDENGWPSGFGGGLVNGLGLEYQQKYLRHEILDAAEVAGRENTIAFYTSDGKTLLGRELPGKTTGNVLRCFFEVNPYYVDNLNPKVVAKFLRVTHQRYYDTLPKALLKNLRGIFTDEPQLSRKGLLWSFVLEEEYRKAYGRELLVELPQLFISMPESGAMRIRFWGLCARLFTQNFMKQIRDWCDAHGWEITGHHVQEETCQIQISSSGAVMPQYRYYHIPGVDHLGRIPASEVAAIQLVSSAAQFGQKQIMTESFAMTGWGCHFSGMRWIYLQQLAHGINFLCPHLEGYTLRGLRKRDYPASAFYHQPWWKDYRKFTDSVSRIGMILAEGEQKVDVLVIHPISSAWKAYAGDEHYSLLDTYSKSLERTTLALDKLQIGHHYADEYIVNEIGGVEGGEIRIGRGKYHTVIVPQLSNLSAKMAEILPVFQQNGGTIFVVRNQNEDGELTIDGKPASHEFLVWFRALPAFHSEYAAVEAVADSQTDRVVVTENGVSAGSVISTSRTVTLDGRSGRFYYFVNRSYRKSARVTIELPCTAEQLDILDPVSGRLSVLAGVKKENRTFRFTYTFAPASDGCFFVADPAELPVFTVRDPDAGTPALFQKESFTLKSYSGNILTLDRCAYRIDGGTWLHCDVIDLQSRLLSRRCDCDLDLEFEFFCDEDCDFKRPIQLVAETPERFRFALNGKPFAVKDLGYLFDRAFRRLELPGELKIGRNVIGMSLRYTQPELVYKAVDAAKKFESERNKLTFETELESIYLYGDFRVRHKGETETLEKNAVRYNGTFSLGAPLTMAQVDITDLLASGLPFFSGTLTLEKTFELTEEEECPDRTLRVELAGANSCELKLNGADLGGCFWDPYAWHVGPYLKKGLNRIEFKLTTSLRNTLGPHHLEEGECYRVSPLSFCREPDVIGRVPPPYRSGYCFIRFSLGLPSGATAVSQKTETL